MKGNENSGSACIHTEKKDRLYGRASYSIIRTQALRSNPGDPNAPIEFNKKNNSNEKRLNGKNMNKPLMTKKEYINKETFTLKQTNNEKPFRKNLKKACNASMCDDAEKKR